MIKDKDFTEEMLATFQEYVATYEMRHSIQSKKVFILDMLYGLGITIDRDLYEFHNGFQEFKKLLRSDYL